MKKSEAYEERESMVALEISALGYSAWPTMKLQKQSYSYLCVETLLVCDVCRLEWTNDIVSKARSESTYESLPRKQISSFICYIYP